MRKRISEKSVKLKEQQFRIETLEFLLCGGKHEWGKVDTTTTYDAHGEAHVDTVCMCKRCHKRIVE